MGCRQDSLGASHASRLPRPAAALAVLALPLLALALVAPAGANSDDDIPFPDLGDCQELQVRPGNEVILHAFGQGVQVYQWDGTSWIFVAPQAILFADAGRHGIVGIHFGGPTWEHVDGSKVVGTVIDHCTPDLSAIPWLLLDATPAAGQGIFAHVTFIQRLNTVGGNAPAGPGDFIGQVARVPYTADYVFYAADH
jgi:hypothetical protein